MEVMRRIPGEALPMVEREDDKAAVIGLGLGLSSNFEVRDDDVSDGEESATSQGSSTSAITSDDESDAFSGDGGGRLARVGEENMQDNFVKNQFVNIMLVLGFQTMVETVHKNLFAGMCWQAKLHTFLVFSRVLENVSKGCGKVRYAWFGGSKDEIKSILKYGFSSKGRGICFSPFHNPLASLRGAVKDENGLCHLLLCRVILGRSEVVSPTSQQTTPSSEEFHSGVDSILSPRVYMIWSTHMNTHVVPQYVVSFRPPVPVKGKEEVGNVAAATIRKPNSPWMPFPVLLSELAKIVPQNIIGTLQKFHSDHRAGKIHRMQLIQKLRQLVGDHMLFTTITSYRNKLEALKRSTQNNINNLVSPQFGGSKMFAPIKSELADQIDASRKPTPSIRSHAALSQHGNPMKASSNRVLKKMKKLQAAGSGCTDKARVSSSRILNL